jgi:hypothetical protein
MIVEWIMEHSGFDGVWFLGSNRAHPRWWQFIGPDAAYVGCWTGPQSDLICLKHCETNREAEIWLSPPGWTILHAAILAWLKLRRLKIQRAKIKRHRRRYRSIEKADA